MSFVERDAEAERSDKKLPELVVEILSSGARVGDWLKLTALQITQRVNERRAVHPQKVFKSQVNQVLYILEDNEEVFKSSKAGSLKPIWSLTPKARYRITREATKELLRSKKYEAGDVTHVMVDLTNMHGLVYQLKAHVPAEDLRVFLFTNAANIIFPQTSEETPEGMKRYAAESSATMAWTVRLFDVILREVEKVRAGSLPPLSIVMCSTSKRLELLDELKHLYPKEIASVEYVDSWHTLRKYVE